MRKRSLSLVSLLLVAIASFSLLAFTACAPKDPDNGGGEPPHVCSFDGELWEYDALKHWNECSCGEKANEADHNWVFLNTADNMNNYYCDICMNTKAEPVTGGGDEDPEQPVVTKYTLSTGEGVSFDKNGNLYRTPEPLSAMPLAYEAWIQVPTSITGNAGVIFSSDTQYHSYTGVNYSKIEIISNGVPTFSVNGQSVEFSSVDVRSSDYVHLAIVIDINSRTAKCYINGELAQTKTDISVSNSTSTFNHYVGTDLRSGNPYAFKGKIRSLVLFNDIRISTEIVSDMTEIDLSDTNLVGAYDFGVLQSTDTTVDGNGVNSVDLVIEPAWIDPEDVTPLDDYAYSFAVIGDTQYLLDSYPEKMTEIYDWLVENKDEHKINYVMGLGDIVEHLYFENKGENIAKEWQLAREVISKLNGVIPYSLVRGNHDGSRFFNETFGTDEYLAGVDGTYDGKIENTYRTFVAGNYKYMVLTLDYEPSSEVLAWASGVIENNPDCRVIINTHSYLHHDGTYDVGGESGNEPVGQKIWDELAKKHSNIMMVLCGHVPHDPIVYRQDEGDNGNVVTQMLIDPQDLDLHNTPTGMIAMLYFSEDGENVQVRYYSSVRNQYFGLENQFTLNLGSWANVGLITEDEIAPKVTAINPKYGVIGQSYTLPEIVITDENGEDITPTISVYKKSDTEKTPIALTGNTFTPTEGGYYVLKVVATDQAGNETIYERDLPIRANALSANVLEDFGSEVTIESFTSGADAEWLSTWEGRNGVLHIKPNQTESSYYWFRLFEDGKDYSIPFKSIKLRVWVDAKNDNGANIATSFYSAYNGSWQGFANSNDNGWHVVTLADFYNWEYFADSMTTSYGAQLFWSWTKNTHIYIDEITYDATPELIVETDKEEYAKGDTVVLSTSVKGSKWNEFVITVEGPNGEINVDGNSFVMEDKGTYTVTVAITSPAHYATQTTITVEALAEIVKVEDYVDKIAPNTEFTLPTAYAYDPINKTELDGVEITSSVTYNGSEVTVTDGKFTPVNEGVYKVIYSGTLADSTTIETTILVYVSTRLVEFAQSEIAYVANDTEYVAEYQGATGVAKVKVENVGYADLNFVLPQAMVDALIADKTWAKLQLRVYVPNEGLAGSSASVPEFFMNDGNATYWSGGFAYDAWKLITIDRTTYINDAKLANLATGDTFLERNSTHGDGSEHFYIDYIDLLKNPTEFNGELNFDIKEDASQIHGFADSEYLASYQGANGVVKGRYTDDWIGVQFRLNTTIDKLKELTWDYVEFKMTVDFTGERTSWDGLYSNPAGWTYTTDGVWRIYRAEKTGIITQFGSLDTFFTAITSGTGSNDTSRMFTLWNFQKHGNFYFDYFKFGTIVHGDIVNGIETFATEDAIGQVYFDGTTEYLADYEGATGVVKGSYVDDWVGVQFRFNTTVDKLKELTWDYVEFKMTVDFTGERTSWDGLYSNPAGWTYTTDGVWRIYRAEKTGIITQFGSLDAFYKAITSGTGNNDSSRMFTLWNMKQHGNFYFDYVKLGVNETVSE